MFTCLVLLVEALILKFTNSSRSILHQERNKQNDHTQAPMKMIAVTAEIGESSKS